MSGSGKEKERQRKKRTYTCKHYEQFKRSNPGNSTGGVVPQLMRLIIILKNPNACSTVQPSVCFKPGHFQHVSSQLSQPKLQNTQQKAPDTTIHALSPPSGTWLGSHGLTTPGESAWRSLASSPNKGFSESWLATSRLDELDVSVKTGAMGFAPSPSATI